MTTKEPGFSVSSKGKRGGRAIIAAVIGPSLQSTTDLVRLGLFTALVLAVAFGGSWRIFTSGIKSRRARNWPVVMGEFFTADITGGRSPYLVTVTYRYFQDGYQSGTYLKSFESEVDAKEFADSLRSRQIPVHYDPQQPSHSSLIYDEL